MRQEWKLLKAPCSQAAEAACQPPLHACPVREHCIPPGGSSASQPMYHFGGIAIFPTFIAYEGRGCKNYGATVFPPHSFRARVGEKFTFLITGDTDTKSVGKSTILDFHQLQCGFLFLQKLSVSHIWQKRTVFLPFSTLSTLYNVFCYSYLHF